MFVKNTIRKIKSRYRAKQLVREGRPVNLNIGAGATSGKNGWITLDLSKRCDLYWDLMDGIPFPDNSVHSIYSSHVFEHFSYAELIGLLSECERALVPEGQLLVCVPNARHYISAYMEDRELEGWEFYEPALHYHTRIDYVNYAAYMDGHHKHLFDEENLLSILKHAGFEAPRLRDFDNRIDLQNRRFESIYAVAYKSSELSTRSAAA